MQLHREMGTLHARGAELVVIGNGAPHFARAFREDLKLESPLYVDPSLATYRALGLRRGIAATLFNRRTLPNALRALRAGFRQGRTQGDPWQQGGVLVVRPDGTVAYRFVSEAAGEQAPLGEVLLALAPRAA